MTSTLSKQTSSKDIRIEKDSQGVVTLVIDSAGQPVNTMNASFRMALRETMDQLWSDKEALKGVILTSAKSTFFAGGDLTELAHLKPDDGPQVYAMVEGLKHDLRRLETMGIPVACVLNGTALGGGWEIALSCHHRVMVRDSRA